MQIFTVEVSVEQQISSRFIQTIQYFLRFNFGSNFKGRFNKIANSRTSIRYMDVFELFEFITSLKCYILLNFGIRGCCRDDFRFDIDMYRFIPFFVLFL